MRTACTKLRVLPPFSPRSKILMRSRLGQRASMAHRLTITYCGVPQFLPPPLPHLHCCHRVRQRSLRQASQCILSCPWRHAPTCSLLLLVLASLLLMLLPAPLPCISPFAPGPPSCCAPPIVSVCRGFFLSCAAPGCPPLLPLPRTAEHLSAWLPLGSPPAPGRGPTPPERPPGRPQCLAVWHKAGSAADGKRDDQRGDGYHFDKIPN